MLAPYLGDVPHTSTPSHIPGHLLDSPPVVSANRTPEEMRRAVADYVTALHRAYVTQGRMLPPALQGSLLILSGEPFSVLAAAASHLHVVATRQPLGACASEVEIEGELSPLHWRLRFYDPMILPELGLLSAHHDAAREEEEVRRILGVATWLYHLTLRPGSQLTIHHAGHAGTALAHAHCTAAREFAAIRRLARDREALAAEMEGAALAGLPRAQALLAQVLTGGHAEVETVVSSPNPDPGRLRRAVLTALQEQSVRPVSRPCGIPSPEKKETP